MSVQAPSSVILIRPHRFTPNPDTAADNAFQTTGKHLHTEVLAAAAYAEVTRLAQALEAAGVIVHLFEDQDHTRPDSVFPNNWLSTHSGGTWLPSPCMSRTGGASAGLTSLNS